MKIKCLRNIYENKIRPNTGMDIMKTAGVTFPVKNPK